MPFIEALKETLETEYPEPIITLVKPLVIETDLLTKLEKKIENDIKNKPEDFIRFKQDCHNIYASLA